MGNSQEVRDVKQLRLEPLCTDKACDQRFLAACSYKMQRVVFFKQAMLRRNRPRPQYGQVAGLDQLTKFLN